MAFPRRGGASRKPDYSAGLSEALASLEKKTGHRLTPAQKAIPDGMTFREWCEMLGRDGMKVDGKPFTLDDRPAMAWVYDQIPSTEDEAYRFILVLMKCAQVGFTVMEMLATIYLGLKFGPCIVGMFLPDMNLAGVKSSERFMPIVRSIPSVHKLMSQEAADGSGRKSGEGNVTRRRIDEALFVFSWTSGRATTESIPMDVLSFDEVQEMTLDQMEKTVERLSASTYRFTLMGSTANWPDSDIDHWYKRGSRYRFHTKCPTCGEAKPLDDYFPECIRWSAETRMHEYVCPNGHVIEDTQIGEWIADNPEADPPIDVSIPKKKRPLRIRSIHFPQFLSPTIAAGEILDAYNSATDMKNFFNRKLGKPYLDPSQVPVTLEHLARCVEAGKAAGIQWKTRASNTYMGIDQMGNFNVVVIKERLPDNRQAVIHVEEIYHEDPFLRCSELMRAFGVAVCVVEINPNYNDAKRFAVRHQGKVFICNSFGSMVEGMIQWGDAPRLDVSERRTDEDERDRYTLRMDQYKCMQVAMARFTAKEPLCLFPDPQGLVQEVVEKGQRQAVAVLPRAFHHFTKTALVAEKDDETNQYRRSVKKVGIDPHFSYANMLCDVAWARAHGTGTFLLPTDIGITDAMSERAEGLNMPGLPNDVAAMIQVLPAGEVCGKCEAFDVERKVCRERGLIVAPADPGCHFFVAAEQQE
ncbi:phage terminase large subunit family protein [Parvibaculum sp.]|uniref:phage terminase large subunit family protein n=1 Tax=Parvibaculum sp. TaxID=2024848 RepID=UPI0027324113|nr:phage terminase large subunit family protein [Parvibaculum sp.]MDP3327163.1 phage terminase large subunit family protein [Parvibaculum sp.]